MPAIDCRANPVRAHLLPSADDSPLSPRDDAFNLRKRVYTGVVLSHYEKPNYLPLFPLFLARFRSIMGIITVVLLFTLSLDRFRSMRYTGATELRNADGDVGIRSI